MRRFELILPAQDFERRLFQHIDHVVTAMHPDRVDGRHARRRIPGERNIAGLQGVGMKQLYSVAEILFLTGVVEVDQYILTTNEHRTICVIGHWQQIGLTHP